MLYRSAFAALALACATLFPDIAIAESGIASFYGGKHHGRKTASGELFDQNGSTCAHRTARFGSRLRVTHGDRSVVCRVTDRGPWIRGRIIDLSKAHARALGINGIGRVNVAVVK